MEEIWEDIEGYEGLYRISDKGNIFSVRRNIILKQTSDKKGYLRIGLSNNGIVKHYQVHRLVAMTFIPNDDENKNQVNHIDGDKTNNCVENLEWCDNSYNTWHSYNVINTHSRESKTKKKVILLNTGKEYESLAKAEQETGICRRSIRKNCKGESKCTRDPITREKIYWAYADET